MLIWTTLGLWIFFPFHYTISDLRHLVCKMNMLKTIVKWPSFGTELQVDSKTSFKSNISMMECVINIDFFTSIYQLICCLTNTLEFRTSLVAQTVKHLCTMQETEVQSLGQEDLLEKKMETHSSILVWETARTEEPGRIQSIGLQRVGYDLATKQQQQVHWQMNG